MKNSIKFIAIIGSIAVAVFTYKLANADELPCGFVNLWKQFQIKYIQADGRVIDFQEAPGITTSEGQAYTLFFSLVANDQNQFNTILDWTSQHLAQGDLVKHLPAWRWGILADKTWGIIDTKSAADADLWIAYSLLEAGRLWHKPQYTNLGISFLHQIAAQEVAEVPKLGWMLLPGNQGFKLPGKKWLFNSSYYPIQILKRMALADPAGPWSDITKNSFAMLMSVNRYGFSPDWSLYDEQKGWGMDLDQQAIGSYDAIRVYLWAGMLSDNDPDKAMLLEAHSGMAQWLDQGNQSPPERVDTNSGVAVGFGPAGFSAALLPYLDSQKKYSLFSAQLATIKNRSRGELVGEQQNYYDQVLSLFGIGWSNKKFRFDRNGYLVTDWSNTCELR